jgi:hypothetical protein
MTSPPTASYQRKPMTPLGVVVRLIIAWAFVGVPLAWGIYQTYLTAKPLVEPVQVKAAA